MSDPSERKKGEQKKAPVRILRNRKQKDVDFLVIDYKKTDKGIEAEGFWVRRDTLVLLHDDSETIILHEPFDWSEIPISWQ